ncbi:hypothetical protein P154DRAFT_82257 [Amniculicola lignicola CBS 123094]|uniref:Secreted protein n=1 Tax=Amniculicola lignicola CBS 123094 TaxID=1392246 RepID=A0A6A5VW99_9PLEO|nr:hypothetical protein P154DRAFT_82257 [Amniculicola lignicola CBS 123094]
MLLVLRWISSRAGWIAGVDSCLCSGSCRAHNYPQVPTRTELQTGELETATSPQNQGYRTSSGAAWDASSTFNILGPDGTPDRMWRNCRKRCLEITSRPCVQPRNCRCYGRIFRLFVAWLYLSLKDSAQGSVFAFFRFQPLEISPSFSSYIGTQSILFLPGACKWGQFMIRCLRMRGQKGYQVFEMSTA